MACIRRQPAIEQPNNFFGESYVGDKFGQLVNLVKRVLLYHDSLSSYLFILDAIKTFEYHIDACFQSPYILVFVTCGGLF
jgi:hypothetical protein